MTGPDATRAAPIPDRAVTPDRAATSDRAGFSDRANATPDRAATSDRAATPDRADAARGGGRAPVPIRLAIVDDQPLVRAGFRMILSTQPDLEVVGEAGDGAQAVRLVTQLRAAGTAPDIVVMDIRMPVLDGVTATRELCAGGGKPRVIVVTTFDTDEEAFAALQAGASGFLLKNAPPEELLAAIRAVASGDAVVAPRITRRLLDRFAGQLRPAPAGDARLDQLTEREREVLLLVAQGLSNAEIADRLVLAEATVKTHVGRILTKLDLRDRVQAVVLAYETGLVRPAS